MIILDCDNVLSDDEWRLRTIDWDTEDQVERYRVYSKLAIFDEPRNQHLAIAPGKKVAIFTAMRDRYWRTRTAWFHKNKIHHDYLFMRGENDHRSSVEVKQEMLHNLMRMLNLQPNDIIAAYDDHPDIVQMYKRNGVNGIHIAIHNKCVWRKPSVLEK